MANDGTGHTKIKFEDLYNEQIEAAARMFLLIAEKYIRGAFVPDLIHMSMDDLGNVTGDFVENDQLAEILEVFLCGYKDDLMPVLEPLILEKVSQALS